MIVDYPLTTRFNIDGVDAALEGSEWYKGQPVVTDGVSFPWGRQSAFDQPDGAVCSFELRQRLAAGRDEKVLARNLVPHPFWAADDTPQTSTTSNRWGVYANAGATYQLGPGTVYKGRTMARITARDLATVVVSTNLLLNPDGTTGTYWSSGGNGSPALSFGAGYAQITYGATSSSVTGGLGYSLSASDPTLATAPGAHVSGACQAWCSKAQTLALYRQYLDSTGTTLASNQVVVPVAANTWVDLAYNSNGVAPAGTVRTRFLVYSFAGGSLWQAGDILRVRYMTSAMGTNVAPEPFSGSKAPAGNTAYVWSSAVGASASKKQLINQSSGNARLGLRNNNIAGVAPNLQAGKTYWYGTDIQLHATEATASTDALACIMRDDPNGDSAAVTFLTPNTINVPVEQVTRVWFKVAVKANRTVTGVYFTVLRPDAMPDGAFLEVGRWQSKELEYEDEPPPAEDTYIDGDMPSTDDLAYRYAGAAQASVSEQYIPARTVPKILDICHVGSKLEVWTRGDIPGQSTTMTASFANDPDDQRLDVSRYSITSGATAGVDVRTATRQGRRALWISDPGVYTWSTQLALPTQPFTDDTQPDAWDAVPRLLPGESWTLSADVWVPPGVDNVSLKAYAFTAPTIDGLGPACTVTGAASATGSGWQTLTATVTLPAGYAERTGAWIVPALYVDPGADQTWAEQTGTWADHSLSWDDYGRVGVQSLTVQQVGATAREVLVWSGRVTNASIQPAGYNEIVMACSAVDVAGPLAKDNIGDEPWPAETLQARVARITSMAADPITVVIDPSLRDIELSYQDVDNQPVWGLLQDAASSVGGVLWAATHATMGVYLWIEDPASRPAQRQFVESPTSGQVVISGAGADASILSASDLLLDPLQVSQDVSTVITAVEVSWLLQGPNDPETNQPTTEEFTVTRSADQATVDKYGTQPLSVQTQLTSELAAIELADRLLAQARTTDWRLDGLTVDTRVLTRTLPEFDQPDRIGTVLDLLDGTTRLGLPLRLLDLPEWVPADVVTSVYLEGGTYTITNGTWQLDLTASPAGSQGASATWQEMPDSITWADLSPTISWSDAYGVAAPA